MDKIYSRKRIKLPKKVIHYNSNRKSPIIIKIITIICIAIFTAYLVNNSVKPIFKGLAMQKARAIATEVMNKQASDILSRHEYKELVWIMENEETKSNILRTDVVTINKIASEIAFEIERKLLSMKNDKVEIALGALTGSTYLVGTGPKIPIKIIPSGNVTTELKTSFEGKGINQTVYRIYLELDCNINILTPYENLSEKIRNQILLVETVIVGEIPQTYYNLEGVTKEDSLDIINN